MVRGKTETTMSTTTKKTGAQWACLECGRGFRTVAAARRAMHDGCPGCGGSDIDLARGTEEIDEDDACDAKGGAL